MVWHADNLDLRDRAIQLAFDIRKLQRSAREKLVPVERLEQKKQTADQVDIVVAANGARDFPDLQRRLFGTLTPQERVMYERLVERLLPIGQTVDPTLDVYTILFLFSGSTNKVVNVDEALHTAHLVATMRDYARAFVILCKYGLEAGKSALASATQSAKLVNEIIQNEDKLVKYASRTAYLLKLVAIAGLDPDPWVSNLSQIPSEQVQKERLKVAVHELYLRRLASLFFERLCDAIMLHDGLLLNYLTHLTGGQPIHADETANLLMKAMMNAWCNIDISTSVNMIAGTDSRRDSWTDGDPRSSEAVRLLDELKAQIGISGTASATQGSQANYDLAGVVGNLYSGPEDDETLPKEEYDVQAELHDIDRVFVKFLPYPS